MIDNTDNLRFLKYAPLAAGSYLMWYLSFSVNPRLLWFILGPIILLTISFMIWDYRIKKTILPRYIQVLSILTLIITVIFSLWIFW